MATIQYPGQIRLGVYQTVAVFGLAERSANVYRQQLFIEGNSLLSSVFVESLDVGATVTARYVETTTGQDVGEQVSLETHNAISTALTTDKITVPRIHNKPELIVEVTGGSVKFGVYVTVVDSFVTDLDQALVREGGIADLLTDKAIPIAGYDPVDGDYNFARIINGILQVGGEITASELFINKRLYNESLNALADVELTHISYTVPVGKVFRWLGGWGSSTNVTRYRVDVDSATYLTRRTSHDMPNVDLYMPNPIELAAGSTLTVKVLITDCYDENGDIETAIFGSEVDV